MFIKNKKSSNYFSNVFNELGEKQFLHQNYESEMPDQVKKVVSRIDYLYNEVYKKEYSTMEKFINGEGWDNILTQILPSPPVTQDVIERIRDNNNLDFTYVMVENHAARNSGSFGYSSVIFNIPDGGNQQVGDYNFEVSYRIDDFSTNVERNAVGEKSMQNDLVGIIEDLAKVVEKKKDEGGQPVLTQDEIKNIVAESRINSSISIENELTLHIEDDGDVSLYMSRDPSFASNDGTDTDIAYKFTLPALKPVEGRRF